MSQYCDAEISMTEEMLSQYINFVLQQTQDMNEDENDENKCLLDLLQEFADSKGLPLSCFYNPNGLSVDDFNRIVQFSGRGYVTSGEALMNQAKRSISKGGTLNPEKVIIVIPPAVSNQLNRNAEGFSSSSRPIENMIFMGLSTHLTETENATTRDSSGKIISMPKRKFMTGAYNYADNPILTQAIKNIASNTKVLAFKNYWTKIINDNLSRIIANKQSIKNALNSLMNEKNRMNDDGMVGTVTSVTVSPSEVKTDEKANNCDFTYEVTAVYEYEADDSNNDSQQYNSDDQEDSGRDVMQVR